MTDTAMLTAHGTDVDWQVDAAHSSVNFSVRHLMVSTVRGRFGTVSGTVRGFGPGAGSPEVEVTIDAASIHTGIEQRDQHLRSADFFDVARFPTVSFRADRIEGELDGSFKLAGELTIRGVTRPQVLDVEASGVTMDPWGNERAGFSATGKLNRSEFGLTWNQVLETGGLAVSDEIRFSIDVALIRPAG